MQQILLQYPLIVVEVQKQLAFLELLELQKHFSQDRLYAKNRRQYTLYWRPKHFSQTLYQRYYMLNRLNDFSLIIIGTIVGSCVLFGVVSQFIMGKPDSIPEEICEEIIEANTGIKIDLSPNSPEVRPIP